MRISDFVAHLPANLTIPASLVKLAEYDEQPSGGFLPGFVELTTSGHRQVVAWFRGDEEAARPFVVFAHDKADSTFGYWRYHDQPLDQAPLVYLDVEGGDESTVLANTTEEFLLLLALGNPGYTMDLVEGEDEPEDDDDAIRYRAWLTTEMNMTVPTIAEARAIVERARIVHPDLSEWVTQWLQSRRA